MYWSKNPEQKNNDDNNNKLAKIKFNDESLMFLVLNVMMLQTVIILILLQRLTDLKSVDNSEE